MGIPGLWSELESGSSVKSLTALAVEAFESNSNGYRGLRIGIDASIWFFHADYGKEGENPQLRTLFFRCATLLHAPFLPLFIFDGPLRPAEKRGKRIDKSQNKLTAGMKQIIDAFGFEWREAPGEAEAELAYLNAIGFIDAVLSDDVDTFVFGAKTVIRNKSNTLSGNIAKPALNANAKDDKNHTRVFKLEDCPLTRADMLLCALLRGGDYDQKGVDGVGIGVAVALAKCGFSDSLWEAATTLSEDALEAFLVGWRDDVREELRTNSRGILGKKHAKLASKFPNSFPNTKVLMYYITPITSGSKGRDDYYDSIQWSKDPSLPDLASICEFYFEWGFMEIIVKRFRTVMWHGIVMRILRRNVLEKDRAGKSPVPLTPRKGLDDEVVSETPSKLICRHFAKLKLDEAAEDPSLVESLISTRNHTSTDGLLEYRLNIQPAVLVRLTRKGVKGLRTPEERPGWEGELSADEDDSDAGTSKKTRAKKPPAKPDDPLRLWIPASMLRLAEPGMTTRFEEAQNAKARKKAEKSQKSTEGKGKRAKTTPKKKCVASAKKTPSNTLDKFRGTQSTKTKQSALSLDESDLEIFTGDPGPSSTSHRKKHSWTSEEDEENADVMQTLPDELLEPVPKTKAIPKAKPAPKKIPFIVDSDKEEEGGERHGQTAPKSKSGGTTTYDRSSSAPVVVGHEYTKVPGRAQTVPIRDLSGKKASGASQGKQGASSDQSVGADATSKASTSKRSTEIKKPPQKEPTRLSWTYEEDSADEIPASSQSKPKSKTSWMSDYEEEESEDESPQPPMATQQGSATSKSSSSKTGTPAIRDLTSKKPSRKKDTSSTGLNSHFPSVKRSSQSSHSSSAAGDPVPKRQAKSPTEDPPVDKSPRKSKKQTSPRFQHKHPVVISDSEPEDPGKGSHPGSQPLGPKNTERKPSKARQDTKTIDYIELSSSD